MDLQGGGIQGPGAGAACPAEGVAGRHILLGITGSIAAYKAAVLCRLLRTAGAEVRVVMTPLAKQFITPLTMATLSRNPILVEFFDPENGAWNSHVSLGEWADCYLIAPATANTLAKMACGIADNLLLTTYLSARCPEPAEGELASGLTGKGRMAEPAEIAAYVGTLLAAENPEKKKHLSGKRFVVTAGATIEAIDPVRFISNHSSGKMGYAIAGALAARGAQVTLVTGRTSLPTPPGVERVDVLSAAQMYDATTRAFEGADGAVMCAAVADYTPDTVSQTKLKKGEGEMHITLRRTRDIAAELGASKGGRLLVGFALETHDEQANAEAKLARKNFDFIVLNSLRDAGAGFRGDTNKVTFIDRNGREPLPLMPKSEVAGRIVDKIESLLK